MVYGVNKDSTSSLILLPFLLCLLHLQLLFCLAFGWALVCVSLSFPPLPRGYHSYINGVRVEYFCLSKDLYLVTARGRYRHSLHVPAIFAYIRSGRMQSNDNDHSIRQGVMTRQPASLQTRS